MTCAGVMIKDVETVPPDMTVGAALDVLFSRHIRSAPVVDASGKYLGMFNFRTLVGRLLPASATVQGGFTHLDFVSEDMSFFSDRLSEMRRLPVRDVMRTDLPVLHPETVFDEALLQLYRFDSPLAVTDRSSGKVAGLFTKQSAIRVLMGE